MAGKIGGRNSVNTAWNVFVNWMTGGSGRTLKHMLDNINATAQLTRH